MSLFGIGIGVGRQQRRDGGVPYPVGGSELAANVVAGGLSGLGAAVGVGREAVEYGVECGSVGVAESSATLNKVGGFLEFFVSWTEYHRKAVHSRFVDVVDSGTESSAYQGGVGVAVEAGEFAEAVDDQAQTIATVGDAISYIEKAEEGK